MRRAASPPAARTRSGAAHVLASAVGVAAQGISRLAINVLVGRFAGTTALGTYASIMSAAQLLASVWPSSVGSTGARFIARSRAAGGDAHSAPVQRYVVQRAAVSSSVLASLGMAFWYLLSESWQESLVVGAAVLALGGSAAARGILYGQRRTMFCSAWELGTAILAVVVTGAMVLTGAKGPILALPTVLSLMLFACAALPLRLERADPASSRAMDRYTSVAALGNLASSGFLQLSIVASSLMGRDAAGQFAVAVAICSPLTLAVAPVSLALFPAVNEAYGRDDLASVRRQVDLATRGLAFLLMVGVGPIVLLRSPVISTFWGPGFAEAGPITAILLAASVVVALAIPANSCRTARSQHGARTATTAALVALTAGCLSWIVLVPQFGLIGIALGYLAGRSLFSLRLLTWERRNLGLGWTGLCLRVLLAAGSTAALDLGPVGELQAVVIHVLLTVAIFSTDRFLRENVLRMLPWRKNPSR